MLSPFLKRLLFARQLIMINGKIEVLGKPQVMLPSRLVAELEAGISPAISDSIRTDVMREMEAYAAKLGSGEEGLLKNIDEIFGSYGLGRLEIVTINYKNKACVMRLYDSPLHKGGAALSRLTPAILSGVFSFLFRKGVTAKQAGSAQAAYVEYVIRQ